MIGDLEVDDLQRSAMSVTSLLQMMDNLQIRQEEIVVCFCTLVMHGDFLT